MRTEYLPRDKAALYITERFGLSCSKKTLAKWATVGGGPFYRKSRSRALYRISDIEEWFAKRTSSARASTSSPVEPSTSHHLIHEDEIELDLDSFDDRDPYFDEVTRLEEESELDKLLDTAASAHHYFHK